MKKTYVTILCGLFIALQIVFERLLVIDAGFMRVSLVFIPYALGGAIFGPLWNGAICAAADIIGFLIKPGQGAFFPGFTLSAFLSGVAYGMAYKLPTLTVTQPVQNNTRPAMFSSMHKVQANVRPALFSSTRSVIVRTLLAAFCVTILINALLNTLWVAILYDRAYMFYFGSRLVKSLIMLPIQVAVNGFMLRSLGRYIESSVLTKIRKTEG